MIIIQDTTAFSLNWHILRGNSDVQENLLRSKVQVWAIAEDNRYPLSSSYDWEKGLVVDIPDGLPTGVYDVHVIWIKNNDRYMGTRSLNQSHVDKVFAITDVASEATNQGEDITIVINSQVASYGYDGLDAYELAVLRGKCTTDELSWLRGDVVTPKCSTPTITATDITLSTYEGATGYKAVYKIVMECETEGAEIWYQIGNGEQTKYTGEVTYKGTTAEVTDVVVKAVAKKNDMTDSAEATETIQSRKVEVSRTYQNINISEFSYPEIAKAGNGSGLTAQWVPPTLVATQNRVIKYSDDTEITQVLTLEDNGGLAATFSKKSDVNNNITLDESGGISVNGITRVDKIGEIEVTVTRTVDVASASRPSIGTILTPAEGLTPNPTTPDISGGNTTDTPDDLTPSEDTTLGGGSTTTDLTLSATKVAEVKQVVTELTSVVAPTFTGGEYTGSALTIQDGTGYSVVSIQKAPLVEAEGDEQTFAVVSKAEDAADYKVTVKLNDGYIWSDGTTADKVIPFTISKKQLEYPAVSANLTYNGSVQSPTITGTYKSLFSITGTQSATNAGTYSITFNLPAERSANYTLPRSDIGKTQSWQIKKKTNNISVTSIGSLVYDGTAKTLVSVSNPHGATHFAIGRAATTSDPTTPSTQINAGTYTVYWLSEGDTNYEGASGQVTVAIAKAEWTLNWKAGSVPPYEAEQGTMISFEAEGNGTIYYQVNGSTVTEKTYTIGESGITIYAIIAADANHNQRTLSKTVAAVVPYYYIGAGSYGNETSWNTSSWYKNNKTMSGSNDSPVTRVMAEDGIGIKCPKAYSIVLTVYASAGYPYEQELELQTSDDKYNYYMMDGSDTFKITDIVYTKNS